MTNPTIKKSQRVRFEEAVPTNEIVAYFDTQLSSLIAGRGLPIFPGYDDLDNIQFAYITLPSGNTVVLGQYENAPEIGVDLYVDFNPKNNSSTLAANIPALVVETLQYLAIPRETAVWLHPDYETEIDSRYETLRERLSAEHGEIESIPRPTLASSLQNTEHEPIDCFYYDLNIYTREKLPEYWAMLQHNLGLAYFDRIKGERWENLQRSIECFNKSLEVFTQEEFPEKWKMNQIDLRTSVLRFKIFQKTIEQILDRPIKYKDLQGFDLSGANLNYADMFGANLNRAKLVGAKLRQVNLSNADLSDADLSGADLSGANLSGANLSDTTKVDKAQFGYNLGISESMRQELIARGAIFEDVSGDRSESRTLVPR
jgi:hypothetical protein